MSTAGTKAINVATIQKQLSNNATTCTLLSFA